MKWKTILNIGAFDIENHDQLGYIVHHLMIDFQMLSLKWFYGYTKINLYLFEYHMYRITKDTYIYTSWWEDHCPYHTLMKTNLPIAEELKKVILSWYRIRIKYTHSAFSSIVHINWHRIMQRTDKFWPIQFAEWVKLIEWTPMKSWWSNRWPYPTFEEWYCILELDTYWLPDIENYWIEILEINKITK